LGPVIGESIVPHIKRVRIIGEIVIMRHLAPFIRFVERMSY